MKSVVLVFTEHKSLFCYSGLLHNINKLNNGQFGFYVVDCEKSNFSLN